MPRPVFPALFDDGRSWRVRDPSPAHGKPAAVLVSIEAAEVAKRELGKERQGISLVATFSSGFPLDIDLAEGTCLPATGRHRAT